MMILIACTGNHGNEVLNRTENNPSVTESSPSDSAEKEITSKEPAYQNDYEKENEMINVLDFYDEMITNSLISTGNNTRIKKAIEKAKNGEDVTIAYIGGSITEGANANPNTECYAYKSYESFKTLYGKGNGSNIHFVNAGMGGTPSSLGVIRYSYDVLAAAQSAPDIVFIEFAVNDHEEITKGVAYESLVRNILKADNSPAVVLIFSVFRGLWNLQSKYIPIGEAYDLPMVSILNAIAEQINSGAIKNEEFFADDGWHPLNFGHQIMSDCITNLYLQINAQDMAANDIALPAPLVGNDYEDIIYADSQTQINGTEITVGDFTATDKNTGTYLYNNAQKLPNNWKHDSKAGNKPFIIKTTCKNLMLVYKISNSSNLAGKTEVYVDGVLLKTLDSYDKNGWNNAMTDIIFNDNNAKEHVIKIKMSEDSLQKEFTILALGYTIK